MVGYYDLSNGNLYGFLYNGTTYTTLDPPRATYTYVTGVSGDNVIGYYGTNSGNVYGFLYNGTSYTTIAPTRSGLNYALGISGGNVVGTYQYIPKPSGLTLLGIGVATAAGYFGWRQRRQSGTATRHRGIQSADPS